LPGTAALAVVAVRTLLSLGVELRAWKVEAALSEVSAPWKLPIAPLNWP
jgi:hypothetical protein